MSRVMVVSALVALMIGSSMAQAPQVPLFAFAAPDAAAGWQAVNDGVMGGVSDGRFRITERQTLEFSGTLSLENNGGFASVRSRPRALGLQTGDTLVARVRGDGREYQLNLYASARMRAFSYRAPVQTRSGEWIEVAVPLDRFEATSFGRVLREAGPVDPRSVTSIGFLLAEKAPGPFALEVAWIKVLRVRARWDGSNATGGTATILLFLKPALAGAEQALARLLDDRLVLRNGPGIERVSGTILDSTSSMRRDVCGAPSSAERAQDRESLTRRPAGTFGSSACQVGSRKGIERAVTANWCLALERLADVTRSVQERVHDTNASEILSVL
jgi:NADH dehydrogenase [ubiquinone] 1 alpha subcomplex assembly factor 1